MKFVFLRENSIIISNRYRHDLLENGFGVEWMDDNDENHSKNSVISVRSVYNNHNTRLPTQIWRSLAKVKSTKTFFFDFYPF
jgi:hypothetical protein